MAWWILLVILAAVAACPAYLESKRAPVNATSRKASDAKFATLSQGITAYRWIGPVRGPVAVMVHGLTTPSIVFDDLANEMGQLGFRVLVYDLYGRGLSDAPRGAQDRAFFLRQLNDLLADQKLDIDLTLVGYSMGGSIVTAFAAAQPHRVNHVILLATAGLHMTESRFSAFCRQTPVLGDWLHNGIGSLRMRTALNNAPGASQQILSAQKAQLDRRGFFPAVLASRRGMLNDRLEPEHRLLGKQGIPVVAIWAVKDQTIPLAAMGQLAQWNRTARQDEVAGAGHGMPYSHSAAVVDILRNVFRED